MVKLKIFFLILCFIKITAQNGKAWLIGSIKNCENGYTASSNHTNVKIFDDTKEIDFINEGFGAFYAKDVQAKRYVIQYKNIFGQYVNQAVILKEGNNYFVFCTDYFIEPKITTFISSINKLDTLKISFEEASFNLNIQTAKIYFKRNTPYIDIIKNKKIFSKKLKPHILNKLMLLEKKMFAAATIKTDTSSHYKNLIVFELRKRRTEIVNNYIEDWHFYSNFFITIFGEKNYLKN